MTYINFEPLFEPTILALILAPLTLTVLAGFYFHKRGCFLRFLTLVVLALALANPVIIDESREPLTSTIAVVVDRSQSQEIGKRKQDTNQALQALTKRLQQLPQFDVRIVQAGAADENNDGNETRLFSNLKNALRDIPPSRIGGAIMLTDGQVHDIPADLQALGFYAPVHNLITGQPDEFDRRIMFNKAPRFAISGKPLQMSFTVADQGKNTSQNNIANVKVRINGEEVSSQQVPIGEETTLTLNLPHAGSNIIELSTDVLNGEVTPINNQAVAVVDTIRENLRVLLVSGEPHSGERTWRNLLKSDPAVDLVHFTILRPPEKQDGTPIEELSLIAFPTRELFVDKVNDFDLIIFDRYQHLDVLPLLYYDFIAQYVENGGALLVAAGSEYASHASIARTPLYSVLPALPTGSVTEKAFYPRLTDAGKRHPVTRGLEGSNQEPPQWGRWFRTININTPQGEVVMSGADNKPLLVLSRVGKGRVGTLLSDQGWLWARGFEGGGPYAPLYRRIAHWLMQEPDLAEEALTARGDARSLKITRQTMSSKTDKAIITTPSGKEVELALKETHPGLFEGLLATKEVGLYQIKNDDYQTLAHVGPVDAPEFTDIISTTDKLAPLAKLTGGSVIRLHQTQNDPVKLPQITSVKNSKPTSGEGWIGLRETADTQLKSVNRLPLFSGFLSLTAFLLIITGLWYREGR